MYPHKKRVQPFFECKLYIYFLSDLQEVLLYELDRVLRVAKVITSHQKGVLSCRVSTAQTVVVEVSYFYILN